MIPIQQFDRIRQLLALYNNNLVRISDRVVKNAEQGRAFVESDWLNKEFDKLQLEIQGLQTEILAEFNKKV